MSKGLRAIVGVAAVFVGVAFQQPWLIAMGASMALGAVTEPSIKGVSRRQELRAMVRSAIEPQQIVYGRVPRKSGVVAWFDTSGAQNEYIWYVVSVAEHEIDGYETLWIDDKQVDIATQVDVDGFVTHPDFIDSDGNNLVKVGFYTGADDQTADAELVAAHSEWTTNHRGRGVAYFWVRLELDRSSGGTDPDDPTANVWNSGAPRELSVTLRGKKVYDPRLDSTNGGTGAHRLADPSTWEWSENPILQRADYLRSSRFGPGFADTEIDWAAVATQADICDELVDIPGSTTQKRYTSHGVVVVTDTPKAIVESMQSADHGHTLILADGAHLRAGAWEATSHTIDESWLAGGFGVTSATETDAAYNAVRGRYLNETGQQVEFQSKTAAAYETEDGGFRSWRDIELPWVTDEYQAQRLAIIELKKSRQQVAATLTCNYRADMVGIWDTVALNIDEAGYSGKTFRVVGKVRSQDGTFTLSLREEQASDWTYTVPDLAAPPVVPDVVRNPAGVPAPSGLSAATAPEGIRLAWTNPNMSGVSHIEVWAAASNDRSLATLVTRTASESFTHALAESTVRYYWILARGYNGLTSAWHPAGSTDGVSGTAGAAGQGLPGDPGEDALEGYASVDGAAAWVRDQDGSTWNPTATTSDIDWTFQIGGTAVARISRRVTRDAAGLLTVSTTTHPAGDLNTARVTIVVTGGGTRAVTLRATYDHDGHTKAIAQTVTASLSGQDGDDGLSVAEVYCYRRAATAPATPTGGSYSFTTQTLTPPSDWSASIPAGTDPVWVSVTSASVTGTTGADNALTWSSPVQAFANGSDGTDGADGQAVDMVFQRSATQPTTPSGSAGVPAGWYGDVASVPAGDDPIWSSVGTRPDTSTNWTWQTPIKVEGQDGIDGTDGLQRDGLLLNGGFETSAANYWDMGSGGSGFEIVGSPVFSGAYAARVALSINASNVLAQQVVLAPPEGTKLRFIARAQRDESAIPNRDLHLRARFGDSPTGGGSVGDILAAAADSSVSGWQLITGAVTVPSGAQSVAFRFAKESPPNTDETGRWFIDDCWLYPEGEDGFSVAEIYCYRRASSAPATPTGGSFSFTTNTLTPPSGWSASVPAGTDPCYVSITTAAVQGGTGTDSSLTWTSPVIAFENGVDGSDGNDGDDGLSVAIVKCYRRSATAPSTPSGGSFNFGTLALTAPSLWSATVPTGTATLWESQATASITGATGIDSTLSWSAPAAASGTVEENSASGTGSSLTLNDHDSDGRPITVTVNGSLSGTTTTSSGATWALRLQRRIGAGSWATIATWSGEELSAFSAAGPFTWSRETEFNPDQFSIISNTLGVVDNPGPGLIDYFLEFSQNPGGAASLTYNFSLGTREG